MSFQPPLSPAARSILSSPLQFSTSPPVPIPFGGAGGIGRGTPSRGGRGLRPGAGCWRWGLRSRRSPSCCGCCSWGCGWGCGSGWGGCESGCGCGWCCSCRSCGCGCGCRSRCSASWRTRGWAGSRGWGVCERCEQKRETESGPPDGAREEGPALAPQHGPAAPQGGQAQPGCGVSGCGRPSSPPSIPSPPTRGVSPGLGSGEGGK